MLYYTKVKIIDFCVLIYRWTEIVVTVGGKVDSIEYTQEDDSPNDHHTYVRIDIAWL